MALQSEYSRIAGLIEDAITSIVDNSGHKKTGKLLQSIKVTSDDNGIHISTLDYIKYLDDGRLLKEITAKVKQIMSEELPKAIKNELLS